MPAAAACFGRPAAAASLFLTLHGRTPATRFGETAAVAAAAAPSPVVVVSGGAGGGPLVDRQLKPQAQQQAPQWVPQQL